MAIEIIPKKEERQESGLKKNLYYFSIITLSIAIALSFIFFLFSLSFKKEVSSTKNRIEAQKTREILNIEKKISTYYTKTRVLPLIVKERESAIPFFEVVENITHPLVYWSQFKVDVPNKTVNAMGVARNIVVFDQQSRIFEKDDSILSFDILNFDILEDKTVTFPIVIIFN